MRIVGFDHVVLCVADVERSLAFYCGELGLEGLRVEAWRDQRVLFPSVRVSEETIIDLLAVAPDGRNVDHVCLVVSDVDLQELAASGRFEVVDRPDVRWGSKGDGLSLYVRDPDGFIVELRTYT
jgi:catechol 2,3-dioxygenase-like lactoylglutathione lyase family enzyme